MNKIIYGERREMRTNCEICGLNKKCNFCECESCRENENSEAEFYNEETPEEPIGRWLCKDCIKMGGQ